VTPFGRHYGLLEPERALRGQPLEQSEDLFERLARFFGDLGDGRRAVDARDDVRLRRADREPSQIGSG
jgi:hypothetical protein